MEYLRKNGAKNVVDTRFQQEEGYLKDRLKTSENSCETLRAENQKLKNLIN